MANKTLAVKVDTDVRGADKIRGLGDSLGHIGVQVGRIAAAAGAAFVGVGAFTSNFASDLNESLSKVGVVFGDNADEIERWSKNAATALGISQQQALESAGTFGNLFSAMEIGPDVSADMSTSLVELASDLASFNNLDPTEVLDKLRAGIVGEAEPLRTLGVNITAARTEAKALELGLGGVGRELTAAEKATANYALIMEDTALAQGDFARTAGGMANQQRTVAATFQDTMASVGQAFIPLIEAILPQVTTGLQAFGGFVTTNMPTIQAVIKGVLDGIGAGFNFLTTTIIPSAVDVFTWLGTNVFPTLAAAIDWIVVNVIPALVGAFQAVLGWVNENWPTISSVIGQAIGAITNAVGVVWPIVESIATVLFPAVSTAATVLFGALDATFKLIGGVFEVLGTVVSTVIDGITAVWNGLLKYFAGVLKAFEKIGETLFKPLGDGFDSAIKVIKGIWNAFVRFWNGIQISVPAVDVPLVGRVGGFNLGLPDLPFLAKGGIVTRPTLGVIGEKGPEAIIPLDKLQSGTTNITNNFYLQWDGEPPKGRSEDEVIANFQRLVPLIGSVTGY
jgi:phage-related protein